MLHDIILSPHHGSYHIITSDKWYIIHDAYDTTNIVDIINFDKRHVKCALSVGLFNNISKKVLDG